MEDINMEFKKTKLDLSVCEICEAFCLHEDVQVCNICALKVCSNCCDEYESGEVICDYCKDDLI